MSAGCPDDNGRVVPHEYDDNGCCYWCGEHRTERNES